VALDLEGGKPADKPTALKVAIRASDEAARPSRRCLRSQVADGEPG
jgi:hypothetical protein